MLVQSAFRAARLAGDFTGGHSGETAALNQVGGGFQEVIAGPFGVSLLSCVRHSSILVSNRSRWQAGIWVWFPYAAN